MNYTLSKKNCVYFYIGVVIVTCTITYLNAVHSGFLKLDDTGVLDILQSNELSPLRMFFSGGGIYFRPLVTASFLFDLYAFGRDAVSFHIVNILIHILNGLLIYYLTRELLPEDGRKDNYAFAAALLFSLHPVNSEAVVWIAARGDLLCTLFFLLTLILMVKRGTDANVVTLAGLFVMYLFSLLAKEASIGLLIVAPLYYCFLGKSSKIPPQNAVLINVSLFLAAGLYLILRSGQIGAVDIGINKVVSQSAPVGSIITDFLSAYGFYLSKLIYPFPLNFAIVGINRQISMAILVLCIPVALLLFYRDERFRLPLLILMTGIVPPILAFFGKLPWTPFAERYLYLPMVGFSIVSAVFLMSNRKRLPSVLVISCILLFAIPTIHRTVLWTDPVAFWRDAVINSPQFHRTHIGLACALIDEAQYAEAQKHLETAEASGFTKDFLWLNFATLYYAKEDYVNYEKMMAKAADFSQDSTAIYIRLITNIMHIYHDDRDPHKRHRKAIFYYLKAYEKNPSYIDGIYNAGKLYWVMGETQTASYYLKKFVIAKGDTMYKPFAKIILNKINSSQRAGR